jgi:hypothetical protein
MSDPTLSGTALPVNFHRRSPRLEDLSGRRFGQLTAKTYLGNRRWLCVCDCGRETAVTNYALKDGTTKSCGCRHYAGTHGMARHPLYRLWNNMVDRCYDPKCHAYPNYGGRGIRVCERWRNSPAAFIADVSPRPSPKHTIDRVNNDGDYEPGNWRWATPTQQHRNTRKNRVIQYRGETRCLADWADVFGLLSKTIGRRLDAGWDVGRAFTTPVGPSSSRLRAARCGA